jgi:hypothetical protein
MYTATKEQIQEWKKQYGDIFLVKVDDKAVYLKKPSRHTLGMASVMAKENPMKFSETMLADCWLAGDDDIKTNDDYFLAVASKLSDLVQVKEAELEKL